MQRLQKDNINTPEFFNKKFNGTLGVSDMERLYALAKYYKGGVYLDVGCMDSIMPIMLAETNKEVYGLDFADGIINFLAPRFPKVKYRTIKSCYELPFKNGTVDYVVAGEMIEHLEEPQKFMDEAMRVLKKGGCLAISTPYKETAASSIGGKQHIWSYDEEDLNKMLNKPEIGFVKDPGGVSILAWKIKE